MKTQIQAHIGIMALILALLAGLAPRAEAAGCQMPITFGGYTNRSEALTNFPVLVVFSNGVGNSGFNWTNQSFLSPNGYDLRFRDAADTIDLNYEIDSWFTSIAAATNLPGCILWLKAEQGVQTSGSTVTNWLDQSGNGNNGSTVGGNPQLVANGITGDDPAVRFDGVGDYVQTALNVPLTCTIVTVFKQTSTSPSVGPVWQTDIGQSLSGFFPLWSDGKQYLGVNGSPMLNQASTFALNSSYITEVAYDNATPSTKLYSNGSLNQSGVSVPQSSSSFRLGYRSSTDYWVGDIAEVIIYNRVLTSYELIQVNDYLSRKYGIAVSSVPAACIWVQVPTIPANGTGSILAKWGDAANSTQLPCTTNGAVWTNGFVGVWHLSQTTGTAVPDSSTNRYDGTLAGGGATWGSGTIANGLQLDGTSTGYFSLPDISGRFGNNAGTLTMLLKSTTQAGFVTLGSANLNSWYPWTSGKAYMSVFRASGNNRVDDFALSASVDRSKWHQVAITSETGGSTKWRFFQNAGLIQEVAATAIGIPAACYIGKSIQPGDNAIYLTGALDEVRIANVARSTNWVWAEYATMVSNTLFSTYGAVSNTAVSTTYKLPIAFTNYTRAEVLTNFPVLVTFSNGLYGTFAYNTFTAPATGGDLRFMDSSETTYLDFEIEKWATNGASYVWVRVPQLSSNTTIYAKWGGSDTTLPACTTNGAVWESNFKGVWHFPNGGTFTAQDSTTNSKHGTPTNMIAGTGPIGGAGTFNGSNTTATGSCVQTPVVSTANNSVTLSAWINTANGNQDGQGILYNGSDKDGNGYGMFVNKENVTSGNLYILYGGIAWWDTGKGITQNAWHHIAITLSADGKTTTAYVDGLSVGTYNSFGGGNGGAPWPPTLETDIGRDNFIATYHRSFYGLIDEPRVANTIRSANWVWAEYVNVASNAFFNGYGTVIAPATVTTPPQIQNQAPTGVMTNGATFNGRLVTNGFENAAVYVAWGQTNGAVSGSWATTNFWPSGAWTNGSYPSTNMALSANANYYYTFGATNSLTNVVASGYQYLITGELTVQATDPTGRVTLADTAAFTVCRPASCTNEALTVAYTLNGTATNGVNYTNSPAASGTNGTVTIPAGQTNAVITVCPLNLGAPQQTVVLLLVSSNYAIGAANSATCTLAAIGTQYYTSQTGDWTNSATWGNSGPPSSGDSGVIRHGDAYNAWGGVLATTNLGTAGNYATITVVTGGWVAAKAAASSAGTIIANPVTFDGGKIGSGAWDASGGEWTGPITITANGLISAPGRWGSPKLSGKVSGPGGITLTTPDVVGSGGLTLNNAANDFMGSVVVTQGALTLGCDHALPTGKVVNVYSDGKVAADVSQTYASEPPPIINLYGGGLVMGTEGYPNLTNALAFNVSAAGATFNSGGPSWANGRRLTGPIAIASGGTLSIGGSRGGAWTLAGPISGVGVLRFYVFDSLGFCGSSEITGTNNTHSGGTLVATFGASLTNTTIARGEGSLGTGPVIVETNTIMALDKTSSADWTLTNTLAGAGTIQVEDGSTSYRLTAAGTVSPGTNSGHVAILRMDGKLAFGKSGTTPATLAIDVASAGTTPGVHHDQLTIDHPDTTLAASITNCALVLNRTPSPNQMNGLTLTILTAPGVDFSSYGFASTNGLGSGGSVVYGTGSIALTWTAQTPIINNGAYSNLAATSCDVSGYLSSTGDSPTVVRCYYGTNSAGTSGWTYTNNLGTQAVGTVWTSLTGLTSTVKYYYRFYATNDAGEYWSVATSNFTTLGDVYWNDAASGNWNADNANTWNQGTGNYPKEWLNDHVTIDSHTVTLNNSLTAGSTAPADITVATNGTLQTGKDAGGAVRTIDSPLILKGGTLYGEYSPSRTVLNGPVTILGDSVCEPTYEGYYTFAGPISGAAKLTCRFNNHFNAGVNLSSADNTNWTGTLEITGTQDAGVAVQTNRGLGRVTANVYRRLNLSVSQSYGANPKPVINVYPNGMIQFTDGGSKAIASDIPVFMRGGVWSTSASYYQTYNNCTQSGPVTLVSNTVVGCSDYGVVWNFTGPIDGPGQFILQSPGASYGAGTTYLSGNNTYTGGTWVQSGLLVAKSTNAFGSGPVQVDYSTNASHGVIQLAATTPSVNYWVLTNNLAGDGTIKVEDGAGTNTLTVRGTVDPGTNGVSGATNMTGILRVDGDLAFGTGSRLKIDIRGTNGVAGVDFDRLMVDHDLTGLANATLEVAVNGSVTTEMLNGLSLVVVSNATALSGTFGSVVSWPGKVVYNQPAGTVKLTGSDPGSVFRMR